MSEVEAADIHQCSKMFCRNQPNFQVVDDQGRSYGYLCEEHLREFLQLYREGQDDVLE